MLEWGNIEILFSAVNSYLEKNIEINEKVYLSAYEVLIK